MWNKGKNLLLFVLDAPWAILLASIEPESTVVTVNGLIPARSYQFRLCAVNDVGKGQFSKETERWAETMSWIYLYHFTSMVYQWLAVMRKVTRTDAVKKLAAYINSTWIKESDVQFISDIQISDLITESIVYINFYVFGAMLLC